MYNGNIYISNYVYNNHTESELLWTRERESDLGLGKYLNISFEGVLKRRKEELTPFAKESNVGHIIGPHHADHFSDAHRRNRPEKSIISCGYVSYP